MLAVRTRLWPYGIIGAIGAGGMGELEPNKRRLGRQAKSAVLAVRWSCFCRTRHRTRAKRGISC